MKWRLLFKSHRFVPVGANQAYMKAKYDIPDLYILTRDASGFRDVKMAIKFSELNKMYWNWSKKVSDFPISGHLTHSETKPALPALEGLWAFVTSMFRSRLGCQIGHTSYQICTECDNSGTFLENLDSILIWTNWTILGLHKKYTDLLDWNIQGFFPKFWHSGPIRC